MEKVYIRFGELPTNDYVDIYQGLLEDLRVKIIIPEASYLTYQTLAKHLDDPVYIVDGDEICDTIEGGMTLVNARIVGELMFDEKTNTYVCDQTTLWRLKNRPKPVNDTVYEKGFFGLLNRFVDYWNAP